MTLGPGACMLPEGKADNAAGGGRMRRAVAVVMGCGLLLAGVVVAHARGDRELTDGELRAEMAKNSTLAAYVKRNGEPDVAEAHFLADEPPWDDHEVTLYYLDARAEDAAGRVEAAADSAEHAADRAEAIADKATRAFHRGVRK